MRASSLGKLARPGWRILELLQGPDQGSIRNALGITDTSSILLIITEGATDPDAYAEIVG